VDAILGRVAGPPRSAARLLAGCLVAATAGGALGGRALCDEKFGPGWADLRSQEARSLLPLMREAAKKDFRRQARYVADRVLVAAPGQSEATGVLKRWSDADLLAGQGPDAAWTKLRDAKFKELGDKYFHFAETLNAKGLNPVEYWVVVERALAYGGLGGALAKWVATAGYAWMGTWGSVEKKAVYDRIGGLLEAVSFPPEFDDGVLKDRARWPEARVATLRSWRLVTDLPPEDAMRAAYVLITQENHLAATLGTAAKRADETVTDLYLFSKAETYDAVAKPLVREEDHERWKGTSGWHDPWQKRLFVLARDRDNPWTGADANLLGNAVPVLVRRHVAAGGGTTGRGAWLLDGLSGAYEGFVPPRLGEEGGEIVPARCWRLAAARELREGAALLPWPELLETDRAAADAVPRRTLRLKFLGEEREAKEVRVVACQATAFAVGLLLADSGKGAERLAKLLEDLLKRDRMPDLQKSTGWNDAKVFAEANEALDAVPR
jgi:hypothetical protein